MEHIVNFVVDNLRPYVETWGSVPYWLKRIHQNYDSFVDAFVLSDHIEKILLVLFVLITAVLTVKFLYRVGKATISILFDCAKYLFLLVFVLAIIQFRAEIQDTLQPYVNEIYKMFEQHRR